jgi:hypothetical protein
MRRHVVPLLFRLAGVEQLDVPLTAYDLDHVNSAPSLAASARETLKTTRKGRALGLP